MSAWPLSELGNVVEINPKSPRNGALPRTVSFVPMAAVDEVHGTITDRQVREFETVSKGFPLFADGDVLFAKITPCMENGKAAVARDLVNGIGAGSTEFYVLRPSQRVLPEYVFHFVRRNSFRDACKRNFTGSAGQQRVPRSFLEKVALPLPPLEEQRRIVRLLDRAAAIRRRADAARSKARAIIPSLFLDIFGDPDALIGRYGSTPFCELVDFKQLGLVRSARDQKESGNAGYLRMNAITKDGRVDVASLKRADVSLAELAAFELRRGDLLFNTRNSKELVGKMGLYDGPTGVVFNNNILRLRFVQAVNAAFVNSYFLTPPGRSSIEAIKKGTTSVFAVYYKDLGSIPVPLPPRPLQIAFAEQAQRIEATARALDAAAVKAEAMAASLSAEVFG